MISLTVKTLDGRSHEFSVDDELTVEQFKSKAEEKLGVAKSKQRLIFLGKALQDDKKLSEYGVANKVIHLVERTPPPAGAAGTSSSGSGNSSSVGRSASGQAPLPNPNDGAMAGVVPSHAEPFLQNFLGNLLSSIGGATAAAANADTAGGALNVHINMDVIHTGAHQMSNMPTPAAAITQAQSASGTTRSSSSSSSSSS
eukprot:scpid97589/ scgid6480/ Large proline-rich protein bag6; BCL2-associated athanogene 6; HLA-B-associated transcript 3